MFSKSFIGQYIHFDTILKNISITQTGALYQPRGVGWGGRWEGDSSGRRHMYTYGRFMLIWQKTKFCKAIILQLKNKLKNIRNMSTLQTSRNKDKWCTMENSIEKECITWKNTFILTFLFLLVFHIRAFKIIHIQVQPFLCWIFTVPWMKRSQRLQLKFKPYLGS